MPATDDEDAAGALEEAVGHPGRQWEALKERVQGQAIREFRSVQEDWLQLMWTLDTYRRQGVVPLRMGSAKQRPEARLGGIYRGKGGWFAELVALLLVNRTNQPIRPRTRVRGFSQVHQIDLAWPAREQDPLVCCETKVTGGPPYDSTGSRGAMSDWTNRRKELKFAATDLKLWRRQQETEIRHWGVWRASAPPKTYFLWAARLRTEGRSHDDIRKLTAEAQALINTYLEGAGIFAWRGTDDHYEAVPLPAENQVTDLDDVLYRIESEIRALVSSSGQPPQEVRPLKEAVDVGMLLREEPE